MARRRLQKSHCLCFWRALAMGTALSAAVAHADSGEMTLGGQASWQPLQGARLGATVEVGLNEWSALHGEIEAGYAPHDQLQVLGAVGCTLLWDVLLWVPAVGVAVGAHSDEAGVVPRVQLRADLRRWLSRSSWVALYGACEHDTRRFTASLGVSLAALL